MISRRAAEEAIRPERVSPDRGSRLFIACSIAAFTLLGFFLFPGHTYLLSDTQIYAPILEHLRDPSLFQRDLLAQQPHVSFTIYDEAALALASLTGLGFEGVLILQQLVFRALGLFGVFLIASAFRLSPRAALLITGIFSLGANIAGPAVLLIEYEPVPRGFAIPLLFLALGLAAHGRDVAAGIAASIAFLYHPPSVLPFWAAYFCLTLWPARPDVMRRRIWGLVPILSGVVALLILSRLQPGSMDASSLFERLDPETEKLQVWRASYLLVSTWGPLWIPHHVLLWICQMAAFWRVRRWVSQDLRFFLVGLPLIGMLSVPLSYVLLEKLHLGMIPQLQPARMLLFVTAFALVLAGVAAVKASEERRYGESFLWLIPVFTVTVHTKVTDLLWPNFRDPLLMRHASLVLLLAGLATLALWAARCAPRWPGRAAWAAAVVLPFLLIPTYGKVRNYPQVDNPELDSLAAWARSWTPKDAVFQFPDAGVELYPGIFRAHALRAVYADWKAGGQINFLKVFTRVWYPRWRETAPRKFNPKIIDSFAARGIDYAVLKPEHRLAGRTPVFENSRYLAYRLR